MLEICSILFSQWNENNIRYCHWKSNEHLKEGLNGITDLDVLLDKTDKDRGCSCLKKMGFLYCKSQFGSRYPNVDDWIGFDSKTGRLIHLHLHYQMITGHKGMKEYTLPWTEEVLATRVLDEATGVFVSNPNYEIVTLYSRFGLKANYKQKRRAKSSMFSIGKDNEKEIDYLKARIDWSTVSLIVKRYYGSDAETFMNLLKKTSICGQDYLRLIRLAKKNNRNNCRYSAFGVSYRTLFFFFSRKILGFSKSHGATLILRKTPIIGHGPVIAFLGQDGAGKSTVTRDVQKWLSWKLEVSQFYLGSGDHFQPWEKRLGRKLQGSNNPIARMIRNWLPFSYLSKLSKNVYKTIVKANNYANKGGIVLYDRYPQMVYEGVNDGPKIRSDIMGRAKGLLRPIAEYYARKEERYLKKAVSYTPDVVIKLMLSPEESIRRKPHENYEKVKIKHEIIKNYDFGCRSVYIVDAMQPYEEELIEIKNIIWQHIQKY